MLSTDLSTAGPILLVSIPVICLGLAITCALFARSARSEAAKCYEWVEAVSKMRNPAAKVAQLSAEVTELTDSYDALLKSHKKLRARIGMREARRKKADLDTGNGSDLSSETDKRALRLAAKNAGLLK